MDFDLLDSPLHWITVNWPVLLKGATEDDLSTPGEASIDVRVELVDRDEAMALFPNMFAKQGEEVAEPKLKEAELIERLVKGWRRFKIGGKPAEFNRTNIEKLLAVPMFGNSFALTYVAALGGRVDVREGNSSGLPSGGQAGAPEAAATTSSSETVADSA